VSNGEGPGKKSKSAIRKLLCKREWQKRKRLVKKKTKEITRIARKAEGGLTKGVKMSRVIRGINKGWGTSESRKKVKKRGCIKVGH